MGCSFQSWRHLPLQCFTHYSWYIWPPYIWARNTYIYCTACDLFCVYWSGVIHFCRTCWVSQQVSSCIAVVLIHQVLLLFYVRMIVKVNNTSCFLDRFRFCTSTCKKNLLDMKTSLTIMFKINASSPSHEVHGIKLLSLVYITNFIKGLNSHILHQYAHSNHILNVL